MVILLIPLWLWVAMVLLGLVLFVVIVAVLALDTSTSQAAQDWHYQCDSAIGSDPSASESDVSTAAVATETVAPSDRPTANPYAGVTFGPDDGASAWDRACASAMAAAPYQLSPLQVSASGAVVDCARQLALGEVGRQVVGTPAVLTRELVYQASGVARTGQCGGAGAAEPGVAVSPTGAVMAPAASAGTCTQPEGSAGLVQLPDTVAAQGLCGQRVSATAVSAGDLVFWGYRDNAPTRVGMALGVEQLVTVDDSGRVIEAAIPTSGDVRVKRVLGSSS